ncbi:hypothetical protein HC031_13230 [Planosporangium thailandense]|uniref:Uncharacterized protein n=1 Tax=Planosporangium thailandense TaxID=765197 RepID=A0ABX0XXX9_9ACTN|nr:hypothetical protein [Planosporangium thailandense]NJC70668.1 hypothetical protein [Planosporangium thailandense]
MADWRPALAIVEKAYRGAVETQFFDALYSAVELHRQLGGLEVLLRGAAASYAVEAPPVPTLTIGGRIVDTLNDARHGLRALLDAGVAVWVEEPGLAALGPHTRTRLVPGVRRVAAGELAGQWSTYRMVFFL